MFFLPDAQVCAACQHEQSMALSCAMDVALCTVAAFLGFCLAILRLSILGQLRDTSCGETGRYAVQCGAVAVLHLADRARSQVMRLRPLALLYLVLMTCVPPAAVGGTGKNLITGNNNAPAQRCDVLALRHVSTWIRSSGSTRTLGKCSSLG